MEICQKNMMIDLERYGKVSVKASILELPHGKTNNVVFEQVQHKLSYTASEDG